MRKKKICASVLAVAIICIAILSFSGTAQATDRYFEISNLGVGTARWSTYSYLKRQTDMQAYCDATSLTAGLMTCRLYLTDKSTRAMANPMTITTSDMSDTGAITYGAGTSYHVYMSFKNSGTQQFSVRGYWGTRN